MSFHEFKNVFWNEIDQRVWRTNTSMDDISIRYDYVGRMTEAEFELFLEILFELFDDRKITIKQFRDIFVDLRGFCNQIKDLTEE